MPDLLTLFNVLITLGLIIGSFVAYRRGFAQTANEVQERVINALQHEIQTLHDRIAALEQENARLDQTIALICSVLKRRGIHVTVEGDIVNIHDHLDESYRSNPRTTGDEETASTGTELTGSRSKRRGRRRASGQAEE